MKISVSALPPIYKCRFATHYLFTITSYLLLFVFARKQKDFVHKTGRSLKKLSSAVPPAFSLKEQTLSAVCNGTANPLPPTVIFSGTAQKGTSNHCKIGLLTAQDKPSLKITNDFTFLYQRIYIQISISIISQFLKIASIYFTLLYICRSTQFLL